MRKQKCINVEMQTLEKNKTCEMVEELTIGNNRIKGNEALREGAKIHFQNLYTEQHDHRLNWTIYLLTSFLIKTRST